MSYLEILQNIEQNVREITIELPSIKADFENSPQLSNPHMQ